ncbi:hypothetical protein QWA68_007377 [Fusarium oxysporum]|nr:hypothetical protein QWA68_007377 [Fusarium oxysporum]
MANTTGLPKDDSLASICPSKHLKGLRAGDSRPWLSTIQGINTGSVYVHAEGNGESFLSLLVLEAEPVCGDAAAHVEEKKPNAARYSNIVTVANLQRGPTSLFAGPRPPSFDPPISSPLELSLILSGLRCRVAFS